MRHSCYIGLAQSNALAWRSERSRQPGTLCLRREVLERSLRGAAASPRVARLRGPPSPRSRAEASLSLSLVPLTALSLRRHPSRPPSSLLPSSFSLAALANMGVAEYLKLGASSCSRCLAGRRLGRTRRDRPTSSQVDDLSPASSSGVIKGRWLSRACWLTLLSPLNRRHRSCHASRASSGVLTRRRAASLNEG